MSLYHDHRQKQTRPTLAEWSKWLQFEVRRPSNVFIVIDALDECPESEGTRESFLAAIQKLQPTIRLLITSRHIPTIERVFEMAAQVEIRASDEDVRRYLERRIASAPQLERHMIKDQTLKDRIVSALVKKAEGMYVFIYPKLKSCLL